MPITAGSTPATAEPANAPSGSIPSAFARSALAITSAAAPSLIPLALPAVTEPRGPKRRLQGGELLDGRARPRMLVVDELAHRHQLVREPAGLVRGVPARLRSGREGILILARDA